MGIVVWDVLCPVGEMLSDGMDRWRSRHPVLAWLAVLGVANHLLRVSSRIDAVRAVGWVRGGLRSR
ncbi:MAG: hypothetical protein QM662_14120 [Gordonia sp. (in: high G+C Gram-positive bacteria)]